MRCSESRSWNCGAKSNFPDEKTCDLHRRPRGDDRAAHSPDAGRARGCGGAAHSTGAAPRPECAGRVSQPSGLVRALPARRRGRRGPRLARKPANQGHRHEHGAPGPFRMGLWAARDFARAQRADSPRSASRQLRLLSRRLHPRRAAPHRAGAAPAHRAADHQRGIRLFRRGVR